MKAKYLSLFFGVAALLLLITACTREVEVVKEVEVIKEVR